MGKNPKYPNQGQEKERRGTTSSKEKSALSSNIEQKIKEALFSMNTKNKKELEESLGKEEFLEQLRKYFQEQHPSLLDEIENKDKLKIYIDQLKNQGFTIETIVAQAKSLDESFKESQSEYEVTTNSISKLQKYCEENESVPNSTFDDFAAFAKIETTPIGITKQSKIQKASDLEAQRNKFIDDKKPDLKDTDKKNISKIMSPKYAPTTRLLISAAIKKIRKNLPSNLVNDFDSRFEMPIKITSEIQTLSQLKNEWIIFLQAHKNEIDEETAKKLDKIKIFNQDLYEEFDEEGIDFDKSKGFSEQSQAFRIVFNKLATRQLFDEISKKNTIAEMQIEDIGDIFNGFPPYLNDIFKAYPYQEQAIKDIDPAFKKDIEAIDEEIKKINDAGSKKEDEEVNKKNLQKLAELKEKKNKRKRQGYAKYLAQQHSHTNNEFSHLNNHIGEAMAALIENNFDVSKLSKKDQQALLNILVQKKLEKIISQGTADSLGIDEEKFISFMKDFFDLEKKEITIPGPNGDISFTCKEKSFLGGPLLESLEIDMWGPVLAESNKKNLPLNIKLDLNGDNKDYFEKSPIFEELFPKFEAKNGSQKLNDSYKVKITDNEGNRVEGYLSNYPPQGDEKKNYFHNKQQTDGGQRFLYTQPITRPEDDRKLVFWDKNKPAIIKSNEESLYNVDIKDRELNLNGKAIGAMLLGATIGQHAQENKLNTEQVHDLEDKFDRLKRDDVYVDTLDQKEKKETETDKKEEIKEDPEKEELKKFYEARKNLKGYQTIENTSGNKDDINKYGFVKGAKMLVPAIPSLLPPQKGDTLGYINMEITDIDEKNKKFKIKVSGGETKFSGADGDVITIPMNGNSFDKIKKTFNKDIYKLPPKIEEHPNKMIGILEEANFEGTNPSKFFKDLERNGKSRSKNTGTKKEEIIYFGKSEITPGELMDAPPTMETICRVEYHAGKERPYTVYIYDKQPDKEGVYEKSSMDAINFALFIASKKLSPKTKDEVEKKEKEQQAGLQQAKIGTKIPVTLSAIKNLFKTIGKKVSEGMKKYKDGQEEDFIDTMMFEGKIMGRLASIMPTDKLKNAFGKVGAEYIAERDNKVRKKIEDYVKFYEGDPDFGGDKMRAAEIEPYLKGLKPFKNQRQAAAMLLATIKKGKGPYSRNTDWAGKGMWIKALMGPGHQQRYLTMKEKLEKELQEGINLNGQQWANDKQDEILKLEMKYITHVIDGRQLRSEDTPDLEKMFSKKFAGELETRSNEFFKDTASNAYNNTKDISFELARFEYFRLLGDRPQQAIANLKALAEKAVTKSQWKVFESAVLTGMMCGAFNSMTQSDKKFIEKICRATGFLPGLLNRQPNVHHKIAKLLKLATGKDIVYGKGTVYNASSFDFGQMKDGKQSKDFANYDTGFNAWYNKDGNHELIKNFFSFKGTNAAGKKLIDIYEDPNTSNDIKQLLGEIIGKRYETNETPDSDVMSNGKSLQQNILCRNQSIIDDIIKFQDGTFRGKDKDAIEDAKATRKCIKDEIKDYKVEGDNDAIYMMKLFANWFEDKGFSSEGKRFLIRSLKTVKSELDKKNYESAKQILRYTVVGKIIRSSGSGQVPDELRGALEAFEKFFEQNIDRILKPTVIAKGFGEEYIPELEKKPYKVAPRERYEKTIVYNKGALVNALPPDERAKIQKEKVEYNLEGYINSKIYKIARELEEREYGIPNAFKAMFDIEKDKKDTKQQLEETLSGKAIDLQNHIQIQNAEKRKTIGIEDLSEEDQALMYDEDDDDDY